MVRQLRRQIVNRVGLARAGRPVKQKSFPRLKPQRLELIPRRHESAHIAVEQRQGFARQDNVFPTDFRQPVHPDRAAAAHWIDLRLERDDAAPVGPALADLKLDLAEQLLGKLRPALAGRNRNFNLHPRPEPEAAGWRHHDGERQILFARQP